MTFQFTERQKEALEIIAGPATHIMLYGGSRSGKTFLHIRNVVLRAVKAPESHHIVLRFRFNHLKASIIYGTFPKVMKLCFPNVEWELNKTDWVVRLSNGSEIWFGGLDDKERTEKILGQEYSTMLFNEASQIPKAAKDTALTRLAEKAMIKIDGIQGIALRPRAFYDCNPPSKNHWTYLEFVKKVDPETKQPVAKPEDYEHFKMNPQDNAANITDNYLETLNNMSARMRKRFRDGDFADATPNALFTDENIEMWRAESDDVPQLVRVVVGVDPSGSGDKSNTENDAIGIVVGGLGIDGNAYLLEDCTVKAGPGVWGRVSVGAFDRHEADIIVGEVNYGGAMVKHVIQTARPGVPYKAVTATRGKAIRAEPFSALYERGSVRHVGQFVALEEEITSFSTVGYTGPNSPNRADAWFWVLAELFPAIVVDRNKKKVDVEVIPTLNYFARK